MLAAAEDVKRAQEKLTPSIPPIDFPIVLPPNRTADLEQEVRELATRVDEQNAEIAGLRAELRDDGAELRRRVTQTDLRTERMARHFDPDPPDVGQSDLPENVD